MSGTEAGWRREERKRGFEAHRGSRGASTHVTPAVALERLLVHVVEVAISRMARAHVNPRRTRGGHSPARPRVERTGALRVENDDNVFLSGRRVAERRVSDESASAVFEQKQWLM